MYGGCDAVSYEVDDGINARSERAEDSLSGRVLLAGTFRRSELQGIYTFAGAVVETKAVLAQKPRGAQGRLETTRKDGGQKV